MRKKTAGEKPAVADEKSTFEHKKKVDPHVYYKITENYLQPADS